jgi:hypothetical protein
MFMSTAHQINLGTLDVMMLTLLATSAVASPMVKPMSVIAADVKAAIPLLFTVNKTKLPL